MRNVIRLVYINNPVVEITSEPDPRVRDNFLPPPKSFHFL